VRATGRTYRTTLRALVEASIKQQDVVVIVVGRNAMKRMHSDLYRLAPFGSKSGYYSVALPNGSVIRVIQSHHSLRGVKGIRYYDHSVMEKAKQ
jgi:hypothetical protein